MEGLKISPPEGFEVDKSRSSFDEITFKKVEKKLPKSWEELNEIFGFRVDQHNNVTDYSGETNKKAKFVFASSDQAEAVEALARLTVLRKVYREGWEPDWEDESPKCAIRFSCGEMSVGFVTHTHAFLSFKDLDTANLFLKNNKDLILTVRPLLYG